MYDQSVATNFASNYPNCTIIEGDVYLGNATNFVGMEQITEIQGTIQCGGDGECNGANGAAQENFLGLENVISVGGIQLEEHVFSFDGLESLQSITGNLHLDECAFTNFEALANLTEVEGDFESWDSSFDSFIGLQNLTTVGGNFIVDENGPVTNGMFISGLTSVGGSFELDECDLLENFITFTNLTTVGGDFIIDYCPMVASLQGFENLESIGGQLQLRSNDILSDISGIANIAPESISFLKISNNTLLSECAVTSVCGHLLDNGGNEIELNLIGCNTSQEIIDQCGANGVSLLEDVNFKIINSLVYHDLQISNPENLEFTIYDALGKEVKRSNASHKLSLKQLSAGIYVLSLRESGNSFRFIKEK